jgi:hypothetical protein
LPAAVHLCTQGVVVVGGCRRGWEARHRHDATAAPRPHAGVETGAGHIAWLTVDMFQSGTRNAGIAVRFIHEPPSRP